MTDQSVLVTVDDRGVAVVTLNRSQKRNAFDDRMIEKLNQVFSKLSGSTNVNVMVLGADGKDFSAGADLAWMKRVVGYGYDDNLSDARALAAMLKTLNSLPFPTIARIQGAVFGGAVGLVSCCDMAIASRRASFCLSEVKLGLIPSTISPYVIAAIGARAARRYFLTAERFSAQEAASLGLVSEVVDAAWMDDAIANMIDSVLANGPAAVRAAKQLVFDVEKQFVCDQLIDDTCQRIARIRVSDEGREGVSAFLEKRPPQWPRN